MKLELYYMRYMSGYSQVHTAASELVASDFTYAERFGAMQTADIFLGVTSIDIGSEALSLSLTAIH